MSEELSAAMGRMPGDRVARFTPITFALAFVAALRKRDDLSQIPSVRTTIALPRFLTARALRKGRLTARDYVEAAVYLTPVDDQGAAFEEARALMFPKEKGDAAVTVPVVLSAPLEGTETVTRQESAPAEPSILSDLAGMNLDLGNLDLGALDQLLDQKINAAAEMKSLDVLTDLSMSDQAEQRSLASLITLFGGPAELESEGARDEASVRRLLLDRLRQHLGDLAPEQVAHAGRAGFTDEVLSDVQVPWEKAGLLAASGDERLAGLLDEVLTGGSPREIGRTLRFVREADARGVEPFRIRALSTPNHLAEWAEIIEGLGEYVEPPPALVAQSALDNLPRALAAADALEKAFRGLEPSSEEELEEPELKLSVFDAWADALTEVPDLDFLVDVCVPGPRWSGLVEKALARELEHLRGLGSSPVETRVERIGTVSRTGRRLWETDTGAGRSAAGALATALMVLIQDRARFLPLLDALLDVKLVPNDSGQVIAAGTLLGIPEEEIYARLSQPLEQLRFVIMGNVQDARRYQDLVDRIDHLPEDLLEELIACCVRDGNRLGLATLLAIALGPTANRAPPAMVDECLGYKGIGGGENLLLQWFTHRDGLATSFKERIKALARQALLDAALVWMHAGTGGAQQGLVPQSRARPYRQGDELDHVDIEGTLESLVTSGKTLEMIGHDDLFVSDTSSGRAGFGVLIDISGSMSGKDLAVCAIAVVMLLGRLKSEEIALALFESDTHVIKGFDSSRELQEVADELLELRATGGTRVDAALRFIADEFGAQSEQERRVLFLLSDFCFFEERDELRPLLDRLATLDVRFLGAAHGHFDKQRASTFVDTLGGQVTKIASLAKLPEVLLQALSWLAEGSLRR